MATITLHSKCIPAQALSLVKSLPLILESYDFVLAGGTALALQIGHRLSVDLDFFAEESFSTEVLYQELVGAGFDPAVFQEERDTLTVSINETKISFSKYPYYFLEKIRSWKKIPVAGVVDIAAMKLVAIAQRGAKRDFVDLYFIAQDIPFFRIAENAVLRYGKNRINPVHIGKSLVYFADAESDPEPQYVGKRRPTWAAIKEFFVKHVRQMVFDLESAKLPEE